MGRRVTGRGETRQNVEVTGRKATGPGTRRGQTRSPGSTLDEGMGPGEGEGVLS